MTTLSDLAARGSLLVNDGYRTKTTELGIHGYPVLRVAEVGDGIITPVCSDYVREEYRDKIGYKLSRVGDVLLTTKGTVGRRAIMPDLQLQFAYSPQLCFFRVLDDSIDHRWLYYWLGGTDFWSQAIGVSQQTDMAPYISLRDLRAIEINLPMIEEQRGIAATLGALDDKIESNRRAINLLRQLGAAEVEATVGVRRATLQDLVISISRGVTPKYTDGDPAAPLVLNQRCIRDNWISTDAARHMQDRSVAEPKRVCSGDILVNSTGTGTLGRVGRWHHGNLFADSHVSIVKPDSSKIGPTVLAYLMFRREADIENMATGSTGQTELNPLRLGQLELALPSAKGAEALELLLVAFEDRAASLQLENNYLVKARDTFLPDMLSGRIRVPEAQEAVQGVVA